MLLLLSVNSFRPPVVRKRFGHLAMSMSIKDKLAADMKEAMKTRQKEKLTAIRAILSAIKQKEVDERVDVDDEAAIGIMSKLVKKGKESIKSYTDAGRLDLVDSEQAECDFIASYMPTPLSEDEVNRMIDDAIATLGAKDIKGMGKVMAELKPKLLGKADISKVGDIIKKKLTPS